VLERFSADTNRRVRDVANATEHGADGVLGVPDKMRDLGFAEGVVYVDVTGAKQVARDLHLKIIESSAGQIATANKNPIGLYDYPTYQTLTKDPRRYKYSATAMAGLGAVPWLSERNTIQDHIHQISASLSGTVGFITSELTRGETLSTAIQTARTKGYTEPDYREDLNGVDVARKLTILGREAGFPISFDDIAIEPFLPREYLEIPDAEECLAKIKEDLDIVMLERYAQAATRGKQGMTLKYLASLRNNQGSPALTVGLAEVPKESAFGRLNGTDNRIEVVTDQYTVDRPYKLEGPGAGLDLTASVLRRDLLHLQERVSRFL